MLLFHCTTTSRTQLQCANWISVLMCTFWSFSDGMYLHITQTRANPKWLTSLSAALFNQDITTSVWEILVSNVFSPLANCETLSFTVNWTSIPWYVFDLTLSPQIPGLNHTSTSTNSCTPVIRMEAPENWRQRDDENRGNDGKVNTWVNYSLLTL